MTTSQVTSRECIVRMMQRATINYSPVVAIRLIEIMIFAHFPDFINQATFSAVRFFGVRSIVVFNCANYRSISYLRSRFQPRATVETVRALHPLKLNKTWWANTPLWRVRTTTGSEIVLLHVDYGCFPMQSGALHAERVGYLLGRHSYRNVDRKVLCDSTPNESAIYVHDKPSSQNRDYNLDRGVSIGNSNSIYTGMYLETLFINYRTTRDDSSFEIFRSFVRHSLKHDPHTFEHSEKKSTIFFAQTSSQMHRQVGLRFIAYWCVRDSEAGLLWQIHEVYMLLLVLVLPLAIMAFCYTTICWEIWRVMKRRYHLTSRHALHPNNMESIPMTTKRQSVARNERRIRHGDEESRTMKQVVKMLVAVVLLFVLCWGPILIDNVLTAYGYLPRIKIGIQKHLHTAFQLMAYFNSCINPIVYGFMSKHFRKNFLSAACGKWWICCPRRGYRASVVRHPSISQTRTTSMSKIVSSRMK
ncbi:PREDICTED: uncharacterized protein LOC106741903 isoform X2 [Dinoponera quadriceps]|uniref:Uncharacterized protein LOC106741903 isoform X2 n=1 Tax=Dinoponera quadriceps TaxID=609295 RepID=A0A6P3WUH5_DINQU|nr:PREDICTED: uncharacterized protein LOC106741903 isoform X2 [Dinoponera quadriceps]